MTSSLSPSSSRMASCQPRNLVSARNISSLSLSFPECGTYHPLGATRLKMSSGSSDHPTMRSQQSLSMTPRISSQNKMAAARSSGFESVARLPPAVISPSWKTFLKQFDSVRNLDYCDHFQPKVVPNDYHVHVYRENVSHQCWRVQASPESLQVAVPHIHEDSLVTPRGASAPDMVGGRGSVRPRGDVPRARRRH